LVEGPFLLSLTGTQALVARANPAFILAVDVTSDAALLPLGKVDVVGEVVFRVFGALNGLMGYP
jgi:hypothetical protein